MMSPKSSQEVDILIIGAGVIGVCTAYALAERGLAPLVIDQHDICAGSSYGNAGLIVPSHAVPLATPGVIGQALRWLLDPDSPFYIRPRLDWELIRWLWDFYRAANHNTERRIIPILRDLNQASLEIYRQLDQRLNGEFGLQQSGGLFLFQSATGLGKGLAEARLLEEFGVRSRFLGSEETTAMVPYLPRPVAGSLYFPDDAHIRPAAFVNSLAAASRKMGVRFLSGVEVLNLERAGRRVDEIETTQGRFRAKEVVLAGGAWSPAIVKELNLRLPVQPAKGYSISCPRPEWFPELHLHLAEHKMAVTPLGDRLRFAGTLELPGLDLSINRRRVRAIAQAARYCLGIDPLLEPLEIWRGLRPLTPDTLPLIGRTPAMDNLTIATGHGMLGMSMGPITGKLVAQILVGEEPDIDVRPLRPERFAWRCQVTYRTGQPEPRMACQRRIVS